MQQQYPSGHLSQAASCADVTSARCTSGTFPGVLVQVESVHFKITIVSAADR
jgi:hypothetical protein